MPASPHDPIADGRMTIYEFAKRAGVSTATVSRALRDDPFVSAKTRSTIKALAEKWRYRPSPIATRFAQGRTGMIALILPNPENPFYLALAEAVLARAGTFQYEVLTLFCGAGLDQETRSLEAAANLHVDGLVMEMRNWDDHHERIVALARQKPLVLRRWVEPGCPVDAVFPDFCAATATATRHLLALGHRDIGFVGGPNTPCEAGMREALEEAGLAVIPELQFPCGTTAANAYEATRRGLGQGRRPTALIAHNDYLGMGVLRAAAELGLRVPQDLSVIGHDGIPLGAFGYRPLSSMALPVEDTAQRLLECLDQRIRHEAGEAVHHVMPMHLLDRGSTGPCPKRRRPKEA